MPSISALQNGNLSTAVGSQTIPRRAINVLDPIQAINTNTPVQIPSNPIVPVVVQPIGNTHVMLLDSPVQAATNAVVTAESTPVVAVPFYKKWQTYAIAGGILLAIILVFKKK